MKAVGKKGAPALFLAACGLILALSLFPFREETYTLALESRESGKIVKMWEIAPGNQFSLDFTMSIYKVPQSEVFHLTENGEMFLEENIFASYEAAQYYDHNNGFYQDEDGLFHARVDSIVDRVYFPMGFIADHHVTVEGETFYVSKVAHGGERMTLRVMAKGK